MPKMKTNRSTAKRFKITGSGRVTKRRANRNHYLEYKSARRRRRLDRPAEVVGKRKISIKRLLGRA